MIECKSTLFQELVAKKICVVRAYFELELRNAMGRDAWFQILNPDRNYPFIRNGAFAAGACDELQRAV